MINLSKMLAAGVVGLGLAQAGGAQAALVLVGPESFGGTGLGNVNTILTLQARGNSTIEEGSVSWNGSINVITGDAQRGASQTLTRTLGSMGLSAPEELKVVLNASEPAGGSITLESLVMTIFSAAGAALFTTAAPVPVTFPNTDTGTGASGFVFVLDALDRANSDAIVAFGDPANRLGLAARFTDANGGPETLFIAVASSVPVPEPTTLALLGAGLLGLVAIRRRAAA